MIRTKQSVYFKKSVLLPSTSLSTISDVTEEVPLSNYILVRYQASRKSLPCYNRDPRDRALYSEASKRHRPRICCSQGYTPRLGSRARKSYKLEG